MSDFLSQILRGLLPEGHPSAQPTPPRTYPEDTQLGTTLRAIRGEDFFRQQQHADIRMREVYLKLREELAAAGFVEKATGVWQDAAGRTVNVEW